MIGLARPALIGACVSLLAMGAAVAQSPAAAPHAAGASAMQYHEGRLSARIDHRPLVEVLHDLSAVTGTQCILRDPGSGQVLVSAAIESQPFVEGVKTILRGFSYVIYTRQGAALPTVVVFSTGQPAGGRIAPGVLPQAVPSATTAGQSEAEQAEAMTQAEQEETVAQDQAEAMAQAQAKREETMTQALAALRPGAGEPSRHAFDQVVGFRDDPRVTLALVQVALEASESGTRAQATEALWHHAADLAFADAVAVRALERLAGDADAEVQQTARQALADMQQYRQRNPAP